MKKLAKFVGLSALIGLLVGGGMGAAIYLELIDAPPAIAPIVEKLEEVVSSEADATESDAEADASGSKDAGPSSDAADSSDAE